MSELSEENELVPHRCEVSYAGLQQAESISCRLCGLYAKVLEAFAKGEFPAFFQGADEARRTEILEKLRIWVYPKGDPTLRLFFMGTMLKLFITRESDARAVVVEGVSFPYPDVIEQHFYGEEGCVIAPVPDLSNRHWHYSNRGLERAKAWFHRCLDDHDCGESGFYPNRLLDIRGDQIRLFETKGVTDFKGPYVCLSHRWGSSGKRLTSTVVNIDNHINGIPKEEVPRTFQDAIAVCKHMSVSYLWIDTVCILQEFDGMSIEDRAKTEADFAAESSAMARIYQNSQFTICATMSKSMDSGIFPTKYDHWIQVTADDGIEASLRVRVVHTHKTPPTDLETRGWTYQEYLLPPRVLEFGPFDISWRCQRGHFCECEDDSFPINWGWRGELARQTRPPENIHRKVEQWWISIVKHYTRRNLTNHQDKLPALSGLAQLYHEVMDDTYLAGLWRASFPYNLCWYHCNRGHPREMATGIGRRPRLPCAPSWSWASIDGLHNTQCRTWWPETVSYRTKLIYDNPYAVADVRQVCTVYEVTVQPQTSDSFGMVSPGGFLRLGVTLISAKIHIEVQGEPWLFPEQYSKGSLAWTLNQFDEDDTHVRFCFPDCELDDKHLNTRDYLDENRLKIGDEVYCAPIVERLSQRGSERGCLVLKRQQDQEYQRVGFCILFKENPNYDWLAGKDGWEPNAPENRSYALQWSLETATKIKIV